MNSVEQFEYVRGRYFSRDEIDLIRDLVKNNYDKGRTFISVEICKAINWKQPNGWLKDRACRDVLRYFESKEYFKLPESKVVINRRKKNISDISNIAENIDVSIIKDVNFKQIRFQQVKGTKQEALWNVIVNKYHYLGFKVFVGRSLKYLIIYKDRILAALGWCDPAWSIDARNIPLRGMGLSIEEIRHRGVNNGRFLIMPWVKVPNLASYILSKAIKIVITDWNAYYSIRPLYAETFVDPHKFFGTCYMASNWILMGESQGFKKIGLRHENGGSRKLYFLYPLDKEVQRKIIKYVRENNGLY